MKVDGTYKKKGGNENQEISVAKLRLNHNDFIMLKFKEITKTFKTDLTAQAFKALDQVSFEIPEGSMVGFLGANGAGKTTSIKIIMDFIRADSGSMEFSPRLGSTRSEIFKKIGFLPERPYFYPNLTGREFLYFLGGLSELRKSEIEQNMTKWAPRFKIDHALNRPLKTYSKGMLQRIGFLSTILHDPEFVILDEPISGLDPIGRKELKDVIVEIHRAGKTVFFSSHIVSDIEEICDRVIFLQNGKLVYDGGVQALLDSHEKKDYLVKIMGHDFTPATKHHSLVKLAGNITTFLIHRNEKDELLKEILEKKADLIGLELIKPTLEEIFYHIRSN